MTITIKQYKNKLENPILSIDRKLKTDCEVKYKIKHVVFLNIL